MDEWIRSVKRWAGGALIASVALGTVACSETSSPLLGTMIQLLANLSQHVILPAYVELDQQAAVLEQELGRFCANPTAETLTSARTAWRSAQSRYKRIEVIAFGPAKELEIANRVDFWPTRPTNIEQALRDHLIFDEVTLQTLGASVLGLPAIEYLLWARAPESATVLESYASGSLASARCALLVGLGNDLASKAHALANAWAVDGGGYADSLARAGRGSVEYGSAQSAINALVNAISMQLEIVKDDKLGKPLGTKSGGDVSPTSVESPYSRTSKEDILENLEGIRRIYNGTVGTAPVGGLEQLLMLYSPEVAAALRQQIEASIAAVTAIPGSLSEALVQHRDAVEAAYRELQSLRTLFVGSAMSLLGTDTVFGGSDGD